MDKIRIGMLAGALGSLLVVSPSFGAVSLLQGTNLDLSGVAANDTVITFVDKGAEIRKDGSFNFETSDALKLVAGKDKSVIIEHNQLKFNNVAADLAKYGNPRIDFVVGGGLITAEEGTLEMVSDSRLKLISNNVRVDHNLLSFVSDAKYPTPTIDFALEGAKLTAADGLRVEGTKGLAIDEELTVGGTIALNGAIALGDGGDTVAIDSSDWDISTTGAMTGIGAITADGLITGTLGTTITGAIASLNASSNFATNINTGSSTGAVTIGGGSGTVAINSSDWDIDTTGIMTGIGAITSNGLITGSLGTTITGAVVSLNDTSNFATNINTGTSSGAVTIGGGSGTVAINSSDWDIDATGVMTGIGALTSNGAATFVGVNSGAGLLQGALGLTVTGAVASLNESSNFATNINTGTSTGAVTIGGGTATQTVAINSADWDINATGDMTGIGAITADGAIGFTGAITLGNGTSTVAVATTSWDVASTGEMTNLTGISMASGNFGQTGTGTFGTGTGAVSLNGDVAVAANKNLAMTSGTGIATQAFTGTTTTANAITANSLTTGKALSVTATNTAVDDALALNPITLSVTNAQATAPTTNYVGVGLNFTNNPSIAANTEYAMRIQNQLTSNATDNAVAALLVLDNADAAAPAGSTVVTDALRITNSGAIAGGITNAINIASTTVTNDIVLQNGESIDNDTDNQIKLNLGTTGTLLLTGGSNITTDQTTFNLLNTVATTLNIGAAATTALNIGNGAGPYTDISIGSGAGAHTAINIAGTGAIGADTINIGTGGTAADVIHIGDAAVASTITIGNAAATTVSITDDNWSVTAAGVGTFASGSIIGGTTITTKAGAATGDSCTRIGDMVVDYTNGKLYIATVVAAPCTWVVVGTQT